MVAGRSQLVPGLVLMPGAQAAQGGKVVGRGWSVPQLLLHILGDTIVGQSLTPLGLHGRPSVTRSSVGINMGVPVN